MRNISTHLTYNRALRSSFFVYFRISPLPRFTSCKGSLYEELYHDELPLDTGHAILFEPFLIPVPLCIMFSFMFASARAVVMHKNVSRISAIMSIDRM